MIPSTTLACFDKDHMHISKFCRNSCMASRIRKVWEIIHQLGIEGGQPVSEDFRCLQPSLTEMTDWCKHSQSVGSVGFIKIEKGYPSHYQYCFTKVVIFWQVTL